MAQTTYACLEQISMVPKTFQPLKFDYDLADRTAFLTRLFPMCIMPLDWAKGLNPCHIVKLLARLYEGHVHLLQAHGRPYMFKYMFASTLCQIIMFKSFLNVYISSFGSRDKKD